MATKLPPMQSDFMQFLESNAKVVASWPEWKLELFHRSGHRNLDIPNCKWCYTEASAKLKLMLTERCAFLKQPIPDLELSDIRLRKLLKDADFKCRSKIKQEIEKTLELEIDNKYSEIFKHK